MSSTAEQVATQCIDIGKLGQLVRLGSGGQGVVYRAPKIRLDAVKSAAFKQYGSAQLSNLDEMCLRDLVRFLFSLSAAEGAVLTERAAWPVRVVCRGRRVQGFLMPEIPRDFHIDFKLASGGTRTVHAEFQHLLNDDTFATRHGLTLSDRTRFELLADAARGLSFLHKHGIAVGDLSAKNLLYRIKPRPACFFLDCDAMSLAGRSVLPQAETDGWQVPTGSKEPLATPRSDAYKLALLALRIFARHQTTRDVRALPRSVPKPVRSLLDRGLDPKPDRRPPADDWVGPLTSAARQASSALTVPSGAATLPHAPKPSTAPSTTRSTTTRPPRITSTGASTATPTRPVTTATGTRPTGTQAPTSSPKRKRMTAASRRHHVERLGIVRRCSSLAAVALCLAQIVSVLIAARSGAVSWLLLGTRWTHAAAAAVVGGLAWAVGWCLSTAPLHRPPAWLPILALAAAGSGVYTASDPHWVYAGAGQVEAWAVQRQEIVEGLPDQPGEPCQLPIGAAETLGPSRLPLRMVSRFRTAHRVVVFCSTKYLGLVMLTVPLSEDEDMRAQPATVQGDGLIVGDLRPDGLREHVNALAWWTADENEMVVTTEAVVVDVRE